MATQDQRSTSERGFSWLIAGLLLLVMFINYLDRQTLSELAIKQLERALGRSHLQIEILKNVLGE